MQVTTRSRTLRATNSPGGRRRSGRRPPPFQVPMLSESCTISHPVDVRQVVSSTMLPGR
jgi:hypothetical protein